MDDLAQNALDPAANRLLLHTCQGSLRHTLTADEYAYSVFKELVDGACYACGIRTTHRSIARCAIRPIIQDVAKYGCSSKYCVTADLERIDCLAE